MWTREGILWVGFVAGEKEMPLKKKNQVLDIRPTESSILPHIGSQKKNLDDYIDCRLENPVPRNHSLLFEGREKMGGDFANWVRIPEKCSGYDIPPHL